MADDFALLVQIAELKGQVAAVRRRADAADADWRDAEQQIATLRARLSSQSC